MVLAIAPAADTKVLRARGPSTIVAGQDSSGTWRLLFPTPDLEEGDNHIQGFRNYLLPPNSRLVFDDRSGVERLFIIFSLSPEQNLEKLIYRATIASEREPALNTTGS